MKIIGLTGGIASGKSTVSAYLRQLGADIFDADECSRALTAPDGEAIPYIVSRFGPQFVKNGALDRAAMAKLVFNDPEARKELEGIIHPLVFKAAKKAAKTGNGVLIIDAPLLLESGMDAMCDEVWVVYAPAYMRAARAARRSGITEQQAMMRIKAQMPYAQKKRRADFIIDNSGTTEKTLRRVKKLYSAAVDDRLNGKGAFRRGESQVKL